jgi:hypothetical protein
MKKYKDTITLEIKNAHSGYKEKYRLYNVKNILFQLKSSDRWNRCKI